MQVVCKNQLFLTFCKNIWRFGLRFNRKVVPLQSQFNFFYDESTD